MLKFDLRDEKRSMIVRLFAEAKASLAAARRTWLVRKQKVLTEAAVSQGFRCYFVNAGNHYVAHEDVESTTVDDAIKLSLALLTKRPSHLACVGFELWNGREIVHKQKR